MVSLIMELVRNRSFTLTTGNGPQSRLRRLRNGVPQGSVLAPLLFNIYIYDLPATISRRFVYTDGLAILHYSKDWQMLEGTLNQNMATLFSFLQKWKLKLSTAKTVSAAFHLNNREAQRELKIIVEGRNLPFCAEPAYLGVKLDRALTFRKHLESLRKKTDSTRWTHEAIGWFKLGCWCHSIAHSNPGFGPLHCRALRSFLVS